MDLICWFEIIAPAAKPLRGGLKHSAVIGGLALLILALGTLYRVGNPWIALTADYRTGPSQLRTVRLIDGAIVDLGSSTALALANRRVSGVFASQNLDNVVETIATELVARAVSAPPLVTLLF